MVVCRYFLQGRCLFGYTCRNEHVYNTNSGDRGGENSGNNFLGNVLWQMANEVTAAEKGGQWPLTSFAPIEQKSGLPGWEDISPEEVRWTLYEAQKNGTVYQALNQIKEWHDNAEKARNLVKERAPKIVRFINEIINGNQSSRQHGSRNAFSKSMPDAKSSFRFDAALTNIFGNSSSTPPPQTSGNVFGQSSGGFQTPNAFGNVSEQSHPSDSSNIFARPQQQQQQQPQQQQQSPFATGGNAGGVFNQNFPTSNPTNQNIFQGGNAFQSPPPSFAATQSFAANSNIFGSGQSQNAFQQSNQLSHFEGQSYKMENLGFGNASGGKEVDSSVYSKSEDLNENEINSFNSTTFAFGNIPLKPPPQQYC